MYDAEAYRSKEEVEQWRQRDPIRLFAGRLRESGALTDESLAVLDARVGAEVTAAVAFAEAGPWEPVEDLTKDVHTPIVRSIPGGNR
jgi:TPP-dependent pyruvate/acetoin dehydrogenase alpha subunit